MAKQEYDKNIKKVIDGKIIHKRERKYFPNPIYNIKSQIVNYGLLIIGIFLMFVGITIFLLGIFITIFFPTYFNWITSLLIITDICLIAITVLLLARGVYDFLSKETPKLEIDENVAKMGVATTIIIFLTIIMKISKDIEYFSIIDLLYLAISISIFIISLSIFLFIMFEYGKGKESKNGK